MTIGSEQLGLACDRLAGGGLNAPEQRLGAVGIEVPEPVGAHRVRGDAVGGQDRVHACRIDVRDLLHGGQVLRRGAAADLAVGPCRDCSLVDDAVIGARL